MIPPSVPPLAVVRPSSTVLACGPVIEPSFKKEISVVTSALFEVRRSLRFISGMIARCSLDAPWSAARRFSAMNSASTPSIACWPTPRYLSDTPPVCSSSMFAATCAACRCSKPSATLAAAAANPAANASPRPDTSNFFDTSSSTSRISSGSRLSPKPRSAASITTALLKSEAKALPACSKTPSRKNDPSPRSMILASTNSFSVRSPLAMPSSAACRPFSRSFSAASFCLRTAMPATLLPNSSRDRARRSSGACEGNESCSACAVACGTSPCSFSLCLAIIVSC